MNADNARMIKPEPLTVEAFNEFGDVIEVNDSGESFAINQGFTTRYHRISEVDCRGVYASGIISIFRSTPLAQPVKIAMMERHPQGSQAFIPMGNEPYLVVVAPKGELDMSKVKVFLAQPHQGVNYHTGTWHHFCLALNQVSDFVVIDRAGEGNNCDEVLIDSDKTIIIDL